MYDYENKTSQGSGQQPINGEYRYTGPFYQDGYTGQRASYSGTARDSYSTSSIGEVKPAKKKGGWMAFIAKTVCAALIFGVVASAAFQATNYAGKKVVGEDVAAGGAIEETIDTATQLPQADTEQVPTDGYENYQGSSVASIVQNCMPSLVAITNVSVAEVTNYWSIWGGSYQQEQTSTGTGIIIGMNDTELVIVTNNHVIANAKTLTVVFSVDEGKEEVKAVEARVKGADGSKDLGVIAVKLEDIPEETLSGVKVASMGDSSELQVGDQVVAIGNAMGYGQSVTTGIVSALGRSITMQNEDGSTLTNSLIQTDAAINPGNSGGALLNMRGEVIGINEAKYAKSGVEGMGYAIPISDVESIISDLSLRVIRDKVEAGQSGYLGVTCQDVTEDVSNQFDMPKGIYISDVTPGSGADLAGIRKGDIIIKFDRMNTTTQAELRERLSYYSAGETVEIVVQSPNGAEYVEKVLQVTLGARSDMEK